MKDKRELIESGLPEMVATALLSVAVGCEGTDDLKRSMRPEFHDAADELIKRGLVERQWMLSQAGREMLGLKSGE